MSGGAMSRVHSVPIHFFTPRVASMQVRELLGCSPAFTEECRGFSGNCGAWECVRYRIAGALFSFNRHGYSAVTIPGSLRAQH
jgi:hypothetical protein